MPPDCEHVCEICVEFKSKAQGHRERVEVPDSLAVPDAARYDRGNSAKKRFFGGDGGARAILHFRVGDHKS